MIIEWAAAAARAVDQSHLCGKTPYGCVCIQLLRAGWAIRRLRCGGFAKSRAGAAGLTLGILGRLVGMAGGVGIVAVAGAHDQLLVAPSAGFDMDGAVAALAEGLG